MPERAEHGVRKRAFVPSARVATTVDKEGGRDLSATAVCAFHVRLHPLPRCGPRNFMGSVQRRQLVVPRNSLKITFCESWPHLHQRFMNFPKAAGRCGGVFG